MSEVTYFRWPEGTGPWEGHEARVSCDGGLTWTYLVEVPETFVGARCPIVVQVRAVAPKAGLEPSAWSLASEPVPPEPVLLPEPSGPAGLLACLALLLLLRRARASTRLKLRSSWRSFLTPGAKK